MAYLGNTPVTQGFIPAIDYFSGNGSTTAFTLSRPVASVAQVQAVIENVPQNPGTAFTVSGNTITFDGAPPSGTNNIYVYYTSPITQVIQPGQGTVSPSSLSTGGPYWDTSGNLGVGTTNPNGALDVNAAIPRVVLSTSGTARGQVNIAGSAMNITVNEATFPLTFNTGGSETARFSATAKTLILAGGNTSATGTGITFPASQSASSDANTLDDYEEGTYTPVFRQSAGNPSALTYPTQYVCLSSAASPEVDYLAYVKIGRLVFVSGAIRFKPSGAGISGRFNLSLPFSLSGSGYGLSGSVGLYSFNQTLNQGTFLAANASSVDFFDLGAGNGTHVNLTSYGNSEIYFNLYYLTST